MANLDEDAFAASMLDLVKAFETVPHDVLVKAAHDKAYPLPLLRLCLAAYRLSRAIGVDGIFSRKVRATRGITAGAGFAALELRLLLLDLVVILQKRWSPELLIKLYVDELTLALRSNPAELIRMMVMIINFVVYYLEQVLRMEVSKKKSTVVASAPSIAVAIAMNVSNGVVKAADQFDESVQSPPRHFQMHAASVPRPAHGRN